MPKRVERLMGGLEEVRAERPRGRPALPGARRLRQDPADGRTPSKSYGSLEIFTDVNLAIDRGSHVVILGLNGAGKTTLLRMLAGVTSRTPAGSPGPRPKIGYYAQEHDTLDTERTVLENMRSAAPDLQDARCADPRLLPVLRRRRQQARGRAVRRREDPAGAGHDRGLHGNVLLLDEPTNNLDPASRAEILGALRNYTGAVVWSATTRARWRR